MKYQESNDLINAADILDFWGLASDKFICKLYKKAHQFEAMMEFEDE